MSAIASMARGARVSAVRIVVPTLYGRLPTTSARPLPPGTRSRREVAHEGGVHLARARLGGRAVAGVVDDVVRELGLLGQRHLAGDAALAVGGVGVARHQAGALDDFVRDDDDDP